MFVGERVRLRPMEPGDREGVLRLEQDVEALRVRRPWVVVPGYEGEVDAFMERLATNGIDRWHFAILDVEDDGFVGRVVLRGVRWHERHAEMGIAIVRERWGQGIGREATELLLEWAFDDLGLNKVKLDVVARNERAVAMYERLGFEVDARLRNHLIADDEFDDLLLMSLRAQEWRAARAAS